MGKTLLYMITSFMLCACSNGGDNDPEKAVKTAFSATMTDLKESNYDEYFNNVDFGCDMDSIQRSIMLETLIQHQDRQRQNNGGINKFRIMKITFTSDTLCDVFYEITFADNTKEITSQSMERKGEDWKFKLRN